MFVYVCQHREKPKIIGQGSKRKGVRKPGQPTLKLSYKDRCLSQAVSGEIYSEAQVGFVGQIKEQWVRRRMGTRAGQSRIREDIPLRQRRSYSVAGVYRW